MALNVALNSRERRRTEGISVFLDAFWYMFDEYHMRYWIDYDNGLVTVTDDDDRLMLSFTRGVL